MWCWDMEPGWKRQITGGMNLEECFSLPGSALMWYLYSFPSVGPYELKT